MSHQRKDKTMLDNKNTLITSESVYGGRKIQFEIDINKPNWVTIHYENGTFSTSYSKTIYETVLRKIPQDDDTIAQLEYAQRTCTLAGLELKSEGKRAVVVLGVDTHSVLLRFIGDELPCHRAIKNIIGITTNKIELPN